MIEKHIIVLFIRISPPLSPRTLTHDLDAVLWLMDDRIKISVDADTKPVAGPR